MGPNRKTSRDIRALLDKVEVRPIDVARVAVGEPGFRRVG
jgi:hypothetical protein